MKLIPRARPVKFNLKFGNIEISDIEGLRNNFNLDGIIDSINQGQFVRWLEYKGESELAARIEAWKESKGTDSELVCIVLRPGQADCQPIDILKDLMMKGGDERTVDALAQSIRQGIDIDTFRSLFNFAGRHYSWMDKIVDASCNRDLMVEYGTFLKNLKDKKWEEWIRKAILMGYQPRQDAELPKEVQRWTLDERLMEMLPKQASEAKRKIDQVLATNGVMPSSIPRTKINLDTWDFIYRSYSLLKYLVGATISSKGILTILGHFKNADEEDFFYTEKRLISIMGRAAVKDHYDAGLLEKLAENYRPAKWFAEWLSMQAIYNGSLSIASWSLKQWPFSISKEEFNSYTLGKRIAFIVQGMQRRPLYIQP